MFRRLGFSLSRSYSLHSPLLHINKSPLPRPSIFSHFSQNPSFCISFAFSTKMTDTHKPKSTIPHLDKATKPELLRALESSLGSSFSSDPICPPPNPLVIVISGPSGVGKDAVIKKLREVRESLHFVVTATSRPMRPGEVDRTNAQRLR